MQDCGQCPIQRFGKHHGASPFQGLSHIRSNARPVIDLSMLGQRPRRQSRLWPFWRTAHQAQGSVCLRAAVPPRAGVRWRARGVRDSSEVEPDLNRLYVVTGLFSFFYAPLRRRVGGHACMDVRGGTRSIAMTLRPSGPTVRCRPAVAAHLASRADLEASTFVLDAISTIESPLNRGRLMRVCPILRVASNFRNRHELRSTASCPFKRSAGVCSLDGTVRRSLCAHG